jgi:hypothetical protein
MNSDPNQDKATAMQPAGGKDTAKRVRENRRKAALKANMGRRKAQAKAKAVGQAASGIETE